MSDQDVFNQQSQDNGGAPLQEQSSPLEEFVGEGKKYKTVDELVTAFAHSQNHIATLEHENSEARSAIEQYEEKLKQSNSVLNAQNKQDTPTQPEATNSALDEEALRKTVEQVVEQRSTAQIQSDRVKQANDWAYETFGDDAVKKIQEAASSLGVGVDFLKNTASTSVSAFQKLVSENTRGNESVDSVRGSSPSPSNVNTQTVQQGSNEKNFAYYSKMRRENPKQYKQLATQQEMMSQRSKLGKAFYNN